MTPRFDFVFTYWIFTWWLLYMAGLVPFNPKLFLIAGILVNVLEVSHVESRALYLFIGVGLTKLLPLLLVWNAPTSRYDVVFGFFLGLVYLAWLKLHEEPIFKVRTPTMDFLRKYNLS